MNKKASTTTNVIWIIVGVIVIVGLGIFLFTSGVFTASVIDSAEEFDGEFGDIELPDEAVGTDLVVGTANLVTLDVFNATFTGNVDVNGTNGIVQAYAFKFEVESNGFDDLDIDGTLGSTIATTEAVIRKAYVMLDTEGLTIDSTNALPEFAVDLDNNLNKYSIEAENVLKGDYILVTEIKTIAGVTIASGERMLDITFDADTDGDEDEGTVQINNG